MSGTLLYCLVGILFADILTLCGALLNTTVQIAFYEYGVHVEGEVLSLAMNGYIPPFEPVHKINVTPQRPDLERRFTYFRVEYVSPMSFVEVNLDEDTSTLTFYIRFPFIHIPYGMVGYSMKILRSQIWTTWRKHD